MKKKRRKKKKPPSRMDFTTERGKGHRGHYIYIYIYIRNISLPLFVNIKRAENQKDSDPWSFD